MIAVILLNTMLLLPWRFLRLRGQNQPQNPSIYECVSDATVPTSFDFRKSASSDKSKEILDGLE